MNEKGMMALMPQNMSRLSNHNTTKSVFKLQNLAKIHFISISHYVFISRAEHNSRVEHKSTGTRLFLNLLASGYSLAELNTNLLASGSVHFTCIKQGCQVAGISPPWPVF